MTMSFKDQEASPASDSSASSLAGRVLEAATSVVTSAAANATHIPSTAVGVTTLLSQIVSATPTLPSDPWWLLALKFLAPLVMIFGVRAPSSKG